MKCVAKLLDLFYPAPGRYELFFPEETLMKELKSLVEYTRLAPTRDEAVAHPEYEEKLYEAEILLTGWGTPPLPEDLATRGKVKYICHVTGEMRRMVPRVLLEQGILVTNWGNSISRTVAEAALMMILGCLRRVKLVQDEMHIRKGWRPTSTYPVSLFERRVGLFGFGAIAQALVPLLKPFDVTIRAYSPNVPDEVFERLGVERAHSLEELFRTCEIISVHAAKTPANINAINEDLLKLLPDDGVIVNTARGSIINEEDLANQMKAGRLWAALDVYDREPLAPDSPLRGLDRVLLFPHQGGPTLDRYIDVGRHVIANIRRYLNGEPLEAQVTLKHYDLAT